MATRPKREIYAEALAPYGLTVVWDNDNHRWRIYRGRKQVAAFSKRWAEETIKIWEDDDWQAYLHVEGIEGVVAQLAEWGLTSPPQPS